MAQNKFPLVKSILPAGSTFHEVRGPIAWITKAHLEKIERELQSLQKLKNRNLEVEKVLAKNKMLASNFLAIMQGLSQKNKRLKDGLQ